MQKALQERVAEVLQEQKLKPSELAIIAGVTKGLVSQWINGPSKSMSYEAAKKINRRYGYEVDWLMSGSGPKVRRASGVSSPQGAYNVSPGPDVQGEAPLISWVRAGEFEEPVDNLMPGEAERWFPMPKKAGGRTYVLRVEGDSMVNPFGRSYPPGCFIFVDPDQRSPANGARVIAKLEGSDEVTFKAFILDSGRAFLKPLNPQYPPIHEPFRVIGTVIGKWEDD